MNVLAKSKPLLIMAGGSCVIPFINLFSASGGAVAPVLVKDAVPSPQKPEKTSPPEPPAKKLGNCVVTAEKDQKVSKFLTPAFKYIFFSCDNSGREDTTLYSKWNLWIPVDLLIKKEDLFAEGQRVDIKTNTTSIEYGTGDSDFYRATFESESFSNPILHVKWGGSLLEQDDYSVESQIYVVKVTNSGLDNHSMYLKY